VTRGQLPQRAGSLGLTAVGLPPRYPKQCKSFSAKIHSERKTAEYDGTAPPAETINCLSCEGKRHTQGQLARRHDTTSIFNSVQWRNGQCEKWFKGSLW